MEYTAAQKAEAVKLYLEVGPDEAAKRVGCSRRSVYGWLGLHNVQAKTDEQRRIETEDQHTAKREELRQLLLDQALDMLHRMNEMHVEYREVDGQPEQVVHVVPAPADCKNYATAAAILIDKYRLEMGEATARTHAKIEAIETEVDGELRRATEEWKQQFQKSS